MTFLHQLKIAIIFASIGLTAIFALGGIVGITLRIFRIKFSINRYRLSRSNPFYKIEEKPQTSEKSGSQRNTTKPIIQYFFKTFNRNRGNNILKGQTTNNKREYTNDKSAPEPFNNIVNIPVNNSAKNITNLFHLKRILAHRKAKSTKRESNHFFHRSISKKLLITRLLYKLTPKSYGVNSIRFMRRDL